MEYLLKSILCLLILLLIYRVLLQREVLYRFNRFYLLVAIVGSFLIPLVTIEVEREREELAPTENVINEGVARWDIENYESLANESPKLTGVESSVAQQQDLEKPFPWKSILLVIYMAVSFGFLIRFFRNLGRLFNQIRTNTQVTYHGQTLVLQPEELSPYSFLKYIFVWKAGYEQEGISNAVFAHECCHVQERHSWDILFVEALLVPFWFHPGLYIARQAIRLNHEFIADQEVLKSTSVYDYRRELIAALTAGSTLNFASSLNYSLTKKRLKMMDRKTKGSRKYLMALTVFPLLIGTGYFFAEKVESPNPKETMVLGETETNTMQFRPEMETQAMKNYLALYGEYQTQTYENRLFAQPVIWEILDQQKKFRALEARYNALSFADRRRVKRATFPYVKMNDENGREVFVKIEDLTPQQRAAMGC